MEKQFQDVYHKERINLQEATLLIVQKSKEDQIKRLLKLH